MSSKRVLVKGAKYGLRGLNVALWGAGGLLVAGVVNLAASAVGGPNAGKGPSSMITNYAARQMKKVDGAIKNIDEPD